MKKRVISAVVALAIIISLIALGGIYFKIGMAVLSILSMYEILKLRKELPIFIKVISYVLITLSVIFSDVSLLPIILITMSILLVFFDKSEYNVNDFTFVTAFLVLLSTVFTYFIYIRNEDVNILIYLLLITILTDTFALFGGKLFGKHKLIEKVSPKKTIEGSIIGSTFGTIIPSIYYIYMVDPGANILTVIFMTLILSIIGQLGDLVFSSIKRYFNIKDFSNIMPGHGGILDRIDSITMVVLAYQIIINII